MTTEARDLTLTCARRVFSGAYWVPDVIPHRKPQLLLTENLIVVFYIERGTWILLPCIGCGVIDAEASRVITEVLDTLNKGNP